MAHDGRKKNQEESKEEPTERSQLNNVGSLVAPSESPHIPFEMTTTPSEELTNKDKKQSRLAEQGEEKNCSKPRKVFNELVFARRESQMSLMTHERRNKSEESKCKPTTQRQLNSDDNEGDGEEAWVGPGELSQLPFEMTTKLSEELVEKGRKQSTPAEQGEKKKGSKVRKVFDELMFADREYQISFMTHDGREKKRRKLKNELVARKGDSEEAWIGSGEPQIPFESTRKLVEGLAEQDGKQSTPAEQGEKKKYSKPQKVFDELMFADPSMRSTRFPKQPPSKSSNDKENHSSSNEDGLVDGSDHVCFAVSRQNSNYNSLKPPPSDTAASISAKAAILPGTTAVRRHEEPVVQKKKKRKRAEVEVIDMVAILARMERLHGL